MQHFHSIPTVLLVATVLSSLSTLSPAQCNCSGPPGWTFYPHNNPCPSKGCEVLPFGDSQNPPSGLNVKYQQMVRGSFFPSGTSMIGDIGFNSCTLGGLVGHLWEAERIIVTMAQTDASSLVSGFQNNLKRNRSVVLDSSTERWHMAGDQSCGGGQSWNPLGVDRPYTFISALGNLVIDIEIHGLTVKAGYSKGFAAGGSVPRVVATGWKSAPPATGKVDNLGLDIMFSSDAGYVVSRGRGCRSISGNEVSIWGFNAVIGRQLQLQTFGTLWKTPGIVAFGLPLPRRVAAPVGSCWFYFPPLAVVPVITAPNMKVDLKLAVPNDRALIQLRVLSQAAFAEGGSVVSSNYALVVFGAR